MTIEAQIEKELGFKPPRTCGWHLTIKIFIKQEAGSIAMSELSKTKEEWSSMTGRVISMGSDCYPSDRFPSGPSCKLGDYVSIKLPDSTKMHYRGVPMRVLPDDRVLQVIDDPSWVTRD